MTLPYDVIEKICTFVSDKKQFRLVSRIHNFIAEPSIYRKYSSILFTKAAVENDLPLLIRIYNTVDKKEELIHLKDDSVFHESARLGNVSIVNQLYIWMNGDIRQIKLHIEKYSTTLLECSSQGHTAMLTQFYNWSNKEEKKKLIQLNYYACFRTAANYGHLVTMETVFNWAGPKQKIKMISAQEYLPFRVCCEKNYIEIARQIYSWCSSKKEQKKMLQSKDYGCFYSASKGGFVDMMKHLYMWIDDDSSAMIRVEDYIAFRHAALFGDIDVLRLIYNNASTYDRSMMIRCKNHQAFVHARTKEVLIQIYNWASFIDRDRMIRMNDYIVFCSIFWNANINFAGKDKEEVLYLFGKEWFSEQDRGVVEFIVKEELEKRENLNDEKKVEIMNSLRMYLNLA